MDYPILDVPIIGGSLLIAFVAIFHVVVAHFAVGAGLFTATHELLAIRKGDSVMLSFLRQHSRFLILFSFIAGAVSGVGIWFAIGLVSPRATSHLIHLFVWGWATEWSLFIVEIAAGYVYYYTWDRFSPRLHNAIGWIYAFAAFGSLVLINGIISFMLTPGKFAGPGDFWHNIFNPSFWPSTPIRAISASSLAAIFVMILANYTRGYTREQRHGIIIAASKWLIPLVAMVPLAFWYFRSIPEGPRRFIFEQSAIVMVLLFSFGVAASLLIGFYAYAGLLRARQYVNGETALLLLGIAFIATGSMEFVREGIRKPYIIRPAAGDAPGAWQGLYSNQLTPRELESMSQQGTLARSPWFRRLADHPDAAVRGRAIARVQCSSCHTFGGAYNPLAPLVRNWTDGQYRSNLTNLHAAKESMPHIPLNERDRGDLEAFLLTLNPKPAPGSAP